MVRIIVFRGKNQRKDLPPCGNHFYIISEQCFINVAFLSVISDSEVSKKISPKPSLDGKGVVHIISAWGRRCWVTSEPFCKGPRMGPNWIADTDAKSCLIVSFRCEVFDSLFVLDWLDQKVVLDETEAVTWKFEQESVNFHIYSCSPTTPHADTVYSTHCLLKQHCRPL